MGDIVSPRERGRYQGYFGAVFGFASVAGPLVGGFLTDNVDWRWVFYVNLPIGIVALVAVAAALRTPDDRVPHRIDYLGSALMAAGVSCLILITTWGGDDDAWGSPTIVGLAVAAVVLLGLFVAVEARAGEPLMPLRLFRNRVFSTACVIALAVGAALFGATTYLPQYQQVVRGQSATSSGLQLIPLMAGVVLASLVAGQVVSRTGRYRLFPIAGTATMAVGLFLLSDLGVDTGVVRLGLYMALLGIGIGLVMQMLVLVAQNSVQIRDLGTATSTASFARSIGGSFGVALFGSIFNSAFASNQADLGLRPFTGDPTQLSRLPEATRGPYLEAYAEALDTVFLAGVPLALGALVFALLLKEVPLRSSTVPDDRIAGASESFGLAPLAAAGVMEEITVRVRAARAALARLDQLAAGHDLTPAQVAHLRTLFEDRIVHLTEATGRVQRQAGELPPDRWALLVELLEVERRVLATAGARTGVGPGGADTDAAVGAGAGADAGVRHEAALRIAAAHVALSRLDELIADGETTVAAAAPLRDLFESRIDHVRARAEEGLAAGDDVSPAGWALVTDVLAAERELLAAYEAEGEATPATCHRATHHLDT
ncbi:MAG TPA: MFS transporter, partial [Acidimicrobiales bacterium]